VLPHVVTPRNLVFQVGVAQLAREIGDFHLAVVVLVGFQLLVAFVALFGDTTSCRFPVGFLVPRQIVLVEETFGALFAAEPQPDFVVDSVLVALLTGLVGESRRTSIAFKRLFVTLPIQSYAAIRTTTTTLFIRSCCYCCCVLPEFTRGVIVRNSNFLRNCFDS